MLTVRRRCFFIFIVKWLRNENTGAPFSPPELNRCINTSGNPTINRVTAQLTWRASNTNPGRKAAAVPLLPPHGKPPFPKRPSRQLLIISGHNGELQGVKGVCDGVVTGVREGVMGVCEGRVECVCDGGERGRGVTRPTAA